MKTKKNLRMTKSKKNKNKPKLNLTVREEQRNKLEQMASLENRSVSNLIEVMADERLVRLPEGASAGKSSRPKNRGWQKRCWKRTMHLVRRNGEISLL